MKGARPDVGARMGGVLVRALGASALLALSACNSQSTGESGGSGGTGTLQTSTGATFAGPGDGSSSTGLPNCGVDSANAAGCACTPGAAARPCYDGNPAQAGMGVCTKGSQQCTPSGGELGSPVWGECVGAGKPSPMACGDGLDHDCDGAVDPCCNDGDTRACVDQNLPGTQTCAATVWGPCTTVPENPECKGGLAGQPCSTVGTSIAVHTGACNCPNYGAGIPVTSLYCDSTHVWSCFVAGDCVPDACKQCLETNCSAYLTDATCQATLTTATTWLEACGPDRNAWFVGLEGTCPTVSNLNVCKLSNCINNGTCSVY